MGNKMKRFVALVLALVMVFALAACGSEESTSPGEKVYLEDSEILSMFSDPDSYKDKYVKIPGKVFTAPEQDGETLALQLWYDVQNLNYNYIVYTTPGESYAEGDYVIVDGRIDGTFKGENAFGGDVTAPLIKDATVTKSSYIDVVVPTLKEVTPNVTQDQNGFVVNVTKVEYAEAETRVYMTVTNNTDVSMSYGVYSIVILQNGQQIAQDDSSSSRYEGNYAELGYEVAPHSSTSGVLVFPALDQSTAFQILVPDIYSDNYEVEYQDMTLDIPNQ